MPFSAAAIPGKRCSPLRRCTQWLSAAGANATLLRTTRGRGYLLAQTYLGPVSLSPARSHPHLAAGRALRHPRARRRHRRPLPRLEPVVGQARAGGSAAEPVHLRLAVLADRHQPGLLHADGPQRAARRPARLRVRRDPRVQPAAAVVVCARWVWGVPAGLGFCRTRTKDARKRSRRETRTGQGSAPCLRVSLSPCPPSSPARSTPSPRPSCSTPRWDRGTSPARSGCRSPRCTSCGRRGRAAKRAMPRWRRCSWRCRPMRR